MPTGAPPAVGCEGCHQPLGQCHEDHRHGSHERGHAPEGGPPCPGRPEGVAPTNGLPHEHCAG